MTITLATIGFTQKSAEEFFTRLQANDIQCVVDVRLKPYGQLAGFTKQRDLIYFLRHLIGCEYVHLPQLAPDAAILKDYRSADHDWDRYVARFERLMDERQIPASLDKSFFESRRCCLLCSEATPEQCHRRLVAERLQRVWNNLDIIHL